MNDAFSWNFTLANYSAVWAFMVQIGLLLLFLMLGNILRRTIPLFRKCLIPSALLGGTLLLVVDIICKQFGVVLVDNRLMQVITYHCLAIGFAAMTLKTEKSTHKTNKAQIVEFGALQGGSYMLQAFVGLGITLIMFLLTRHGDQVISYICGLILPLAYGQGPGNALSWDINFTNTPATQFAGNGSFGLSLASIGFVVASVFGVLYINIYKKKGTLHVRKAVPEEKFVDQTNPSGSEINDIKNYILPIVVLSLVGTVITYVYIRLVAKECFKGFEHEFFLMSFGTMTGTASNGMILMKEIDPGLRTPTSSLYILSNFPAMVMIAPLLLFLNFAGSSLMNAVIACAIFFTLWVIYTVYLFRRKIFRKRYQNIPVVVWTEKSEE